MNDETQVKAPCYHSTYYHGTNFTQLLKSVWAVTTTEGPVIRMWVPYYGWHFCEHKGQAWVYGKPCDSSRFIKLITQIH